MAVSSASMLLVSPNVGDSASTLPAIKHCRLGHDGFQRPADGEQKNSVLSFYPVPNYFAFQETLRQAVE